MTADELAELALARVSIFTKNFPTTRGIMYRRIGVRLRQLQMKAMKANGDFLGVFATADLTAGAADLNDVVEPTPTPGSIQRITVADPGTSALVAGDEIAIVPLSDPTAAIAPRCTLRDGVLESVGSDLDGVTSIRVDYARLGKVLTATDKATVVDLMEPWIELLVIDLTSYLLSLTTEMDETKKASALALLSAEETEMFDDFMAFVRDYAPTEDRFSRPPSGVAQQAE